MDLQDNKRILTNEAKPVENLQTDSQGLILIPLVILGLVRTIAEVWHLISVIAWEIFE